MAKILFWNVKRWGDGSDTDRHKFREKYVQYLIEQHQPDIFLFCEITSSLTLKSDNVELEKIGAVVKRDPKLRGAQLGYGALYLNDDLLNDDGHIVYEIPHLLDKFSLSNHPAIKTSSQFDLISKRKVIQITDYGGVKLFLYHANASSRASDLVAWISYSLFRDKHIKNFVLIGDFNCEPATLKGKINELIPSIDHKISIRNGKYKTHSDGGIYDYVVYSGCDNLSLNGIYDQWEFQNDLNGRKYNISDHVPILVKY